MRVENLYGNKEFRFKTVLISNIYYNIVNNENFFSPVSPDHNPWNKRDRRDYGDMYGWLVSLLISLTLNFHFLHSSSALPTSRIIFSKRHHTQQSLRDHFYFHLIKTTIFMSVLCYRLKINICEKFFFIFTLYF